MSTRDDLEQQLGELIHGCLPTAEAERLCERITSDPRAARAYAEAKQAADAGLKNGQLAGAKVCCGNNEVCDRPSAALPNCAERNSLRKHALTYAVITLGTVGFFIYYVASSSKDTPSGDDVPLRLQAQLSTSQLHLGESAQVLVELENVSGESQPMTVVVLGLPAGLSPRYEQIDELAEQGRFASYELRESSEHEIAFYWRGVPATAHGGRAIRFAFDVVAKQPGRSTGPASHAYLVYTAKDKHWAKPLTVEIVR